MTRSKKRKLARQGRNYLAMLQRPDMARAVRARKARKNYRGRNEFGKLWLKFLGDWSDVTEKAA